MNNDSPSPPNDSEISEIARELCAKLKISWVNPSRILWYKNVPPDECLISSGVRRHGLLLSSKMQDKLGPEDWRAVICTSLTYRQIQRKFYRSRQGLTRILLPLLLFPLGFVSLLVVLASQSIIVRVVVPVLYLISYVLALGRLFAGENRNMMLAADKEAATILEKGKLSKALKGIANLSEDGAKGSDRSWSRNLRRPTIDDRLESLAK